MGKKDKEQKRLAIMKVEKCKPKKCTLECKRYCPINRQGKLCIEVDKKQPHAKISEVLCIGCNICVKKCPFDAIKIINLPINTPDDQTHRFGENRFALHGLPTPRTGSILGLVGKNGIGKTTALQILTRKITPNFGQFEQDLTWDDVLKKFKGTEIQAYFQKLVQNDYKSAFKVQFVDKVPKMVKGKVGAILQKKNQRPDLFDELVKLLELDHLLDRRLKHLSGGELQRFTILITLLHDVNVYVIDEPTSYLDVKQRLTVSNAIRKYTSSDDNQNYTILVEHDLSILDYMSDHICCLFGEPAAYGVVSLPYSVKEGINVFLDGYLPKENIRFRTYGLNFAKTENEKTQKDLDEKKDAFQKDQEKNTYKYPKMTKKFPGFTLDVDAGSFTTSEIIVLLGENGTGKSTLIEILAGRHPEIDPGLGLKVSHKPQSMAPKYQGTVEELLWARLKGIWNKNQVFKYNIWDPMMMDPLLKNNVQELSGGEIQRLGITVALGKKADIYLIDEPSAYLDVEQRIITAKSIKKFILLMYKTAFVVEHDFIMATYLADKFIVYEGQPGKHCKANSPQIVVEGITFRRDGSNLRPRINKLDSTLDKEQKSNGTFFYVDK